jgi:group I intron endonuclease
MTIVIPDEKDQETIYNLYKNNPGIYCIENTVNGHIYIGSSKNLWRRFLDHNEALDRGKHINKHLQAAYNKYGRDVFIFYRIFECDYNYELLLYEQYFIDKMKPEYNISKIAGKVKFTDEMKRKISIANKGRKLAKPGFGGEKYVGMKFKSPGGVLHTVTTCLTDFCRTHNLNNSAMIKLTKGLDSNKTHKGWIYVPSSTP